MPFACPGIIRGFSFYASKTGSFLIDIFQPNQDTTLYNLAYKIEITVATLGLHHVTLTSDNYLITENNVLGIETDVLTENSLTIEDEQYFTIYIRGYKEENQTPAASFDLTNLTTDLQNIPLNASSNIGSVFPPLQLHLSYGRV